MAYGTHTQSVEAERRKALAHSVRIVFPDSIVLTLGGNLKTYAQYSHDLRANDSDVENLPLLVINPDEFNAEAIDALKESGYYRTLFVAGAKDLLIDQSVEDLEAYYDQQESEIFERVTSGQIAEMAPHQVAHGEHHFDDIAFIVKEYTHASEALAYYTAVAADPEHPDHAEAQEHIQKCTESMRYLRERNDAILEAVRPTEPLSDEKRNQWKQALTKRINTLPNVLNDAFKIGGYQCAVLPYPDSYTLHEDGIRDTRGYASIIERSVQVAPDCSQAVFNEEAFHLIDYDIGFSASPYFANAYAKESREGIMHMDKIAHALLSNHMDTEAGTSAKGSKAPLLADDNDDYRNLFLKEDSHYYAEVLVNLFHCDTTLPSSDLQCEALRALGIDVTGDAQHDHKVIREAVENAVPHIWGLYKGRDGLPSFTQAVQSAISEELEARGGGRS